ncbi:hypothetical protein A1A1_12227 [Planococcus antarcticus DSM 14505]|uniref:Uncharacterized protein n=1 Tax=Planococcus antarcticus DSM 14505 TaxID=1185653 RepID=A0A1C7DFE7_9BACL|nr:hypothetical protein [Planococcus antarcticus]ANU10137.1 hypothetical protein BBH88_07395 [Planococcus antarcticus DSM 14505]EIM06219.1 hypothetical protein A1A1_12227 [Planococcus antarcticus DSM 14505]
MSKCQDCLQNEVFVHFGEEKLCLNCYNGRMAKRFGVVATSYPEGVAIRDGLGEVHHFQLRKRLDPIGIFMEAEELKSAGHDFKVQGDLYCDQGELLLQLIAKAERGMGERYVERGTFPNGQLYDSIKNQRLAGRVECNPTDEGVPLLVVDGKSYTWEEIGKMLMACEGFQVKLEIIDPYKEVEWKTETK